MNGIEKAVGSPQEAMAPLGNIDAWALTIGGASIALALVAIGLSVAFFWLSTKQARMVEEATSKIGGSVDELKLVSRSIQQETFAYMRDSNSRFQDELISRSSVAAGVDEELVETRIEAGVAKLREELRPQFVELANQSDKAEDLEPKLFALIDKTIASTQEVELSVRDHEMESMVLNSLMLADEVEPGNGLTLRIIASFNGLLEKDIETAVQRMATKGLVEVHNTTWNLARLTELARSRDTGRYVRNSLLEDKKISTGHGPLSKLTTIDSQSRIFLKKARGNSDED